MITQTLTQQTLKELKITMKLALPIVLSQLGQLAFGIMDTAIVGRLGAVPLAATAFVNNVCNIPMVFALGVSTAVSVLSAQSYGEKNYKNCGKILNHGLIFVGSITFLIILGLLIASKYLYLFNQPQEVLDLSFGYYTMMTWSILPFILFFVLKNFTEALSHPIVPLIFLMVGLVLNFVFNMLFVFGMYGFPQYGVTGSGLSTLLARIAVVGLLYLFILRSQKFEKYNVSFFKQKFEKFTFESIAKVGVPSGFQFLFEVAAFAGSGIMMGWLGTKTLAAHQISLQIASTTFMMALGLSFAVSVRIGQLKGEENYLGLRQAGIGAFSFVATALGLLGVLIFILRFYLPTLFISDIEVEAMAAQILIIVCLFQIFDSTQAVAMSALRGIQDVKIPTLIAFFAYWIVALPLGYYLAFVVGLKHIGIWASLGIALFCSSTLLMARFLYKTKKLVKDHEIIYG